MKIPDDAGNVDMAAMARAFLRAKDRRVEQANILQFPVNNDIELGSEVDDRGKETGYKVVVSQKDLCESSYLLGLQGTGKSSLIAGMILQQAKNGDSCLVIDPHGSLVDELVKRMPHNRVEDVVVLDVTDIDYPFSLNIFSSLPGQFKDAVLGQLMAAFTQVWPEIKSQQNFELLIQNLLPLILENEELTMIDIFRLLSDAGFRNKYIAKTKNFMCRSFWEWQFEEWGKADKTRNMQALLSRFNKLLSLELVRNILCQRRGMINFRQMIEERKIVLIKLPLKDDRYKLASEKLGVILMSLIQAATFSFADIEKEDDRPGFTLAVDELAAFSTTNTKDLVEGARKYKCKPIFAHQWLSQLEESGLGRDQDALFAAKTMVAFKLLSDDAGKVGRKKFSSVVRRGTNFYTNPLEQKGFREHKSDVIKDFYRVYVKALEDAIKAGKVETDKGYSEYVDTNLLGRDVIKRKTNETLVYPCADLGFGEVNFNPLEIRDLWRKLNDFFYMSQKDFTKAKCELLKNTVEKYILVVGGDFCNYQEEKEIDYLPVLLRREWNIKVVDLFRGDLEKTFPQYQRDWENEEAKTLFWDKLWSDAAEKVIFDLNEEIRVKSKISNEYKDLVEKKEEALNDMIALKKEIYKRLWSDHGSSVYPGLSYFDFIECMESDRRINEGWRSEYWREAKNRYEKVKSTYEVYLDAIYKRGGSFYKGEGVKLRTTGMVCNTDLLDKDVEEAKAELDLIRFGKTEIQLIERVVSKRGREIYKAKGYWKEARIREVNNYIYKKIESIGQREINFTCNEVVSTYLERVEKVKRKYRNEREEKSKRLCEQIESILLSVATVLASEPISVDSGELVDLSKLDKRYTYINIGGHFYYTHIKDLNDVSRAVAGAELKQRWEQIRIQSRKNYARPRGVVEKEIEAGFFGRGDEPPIPSSGVIERPNKPSGSAGGVVDRSEEKRRVVDPSVVPGGSLRGESAGKNKSAGVAPGRGAKKQDDSELPPDAGYTDDPSCWE